MSASYSIAPSAEGIELVLHPERQGLQLAFGAIFALIGLANSIGFAAAGKTMSERAFALIGLIFACIGGVIIAEYNAAHIVAVRRGRLLLIRRLGAFAIARAYDLNYASRLRETIAPAHLEVHARGTPPPMRPALAFDYGNQTVYFAQRVSDLAAVAAELRGIAPSLARPDVPPLLP